MRTFWEEALATRVGDRLGIIVLEGYIFFASAGQILNTFKALVEASAARPKCERMRYIVFDFEHVQNVDFSGVRTFFDLHVCARARVCVCLSAFLFSSALRACYKKTRLDDGKCSFCALRRQ